ncbi:MAG TPA: HemK/PrmC family methyltransferase [Gaiellaceae bacterium]|nr:HemK/PrmC family methyltransferase [Gaiellaceae bacterium]
MTVRDALAEAEGRLANAGIDTPRVDAEWLLAHVLGTTRSGLYADLDRDAGDAWQPLVARREAREPLAYVIGEWGFRRLTLKTDARALVPRPETETAVERALALLAGTDAPRVLDIGTGTAAIALALKDERPDARVTAVDVSADALALAQENAERLGLDIELRNGGIEVAGEGWDLVVSNPPYIEKIEDVQAEVRREPELAVIGTGFHELIARAASTRFLVLEVGDGQARSVAAMLAELGYHDVRITNDLAGVERIVEGSR